MLRPETTCYDTHQPDNTTVSWCRMLEDEMARDIEENPALSWIYGWPPEHPPMPADLGYTDPAEDDLPF